MPGVPSSILPETLWCPLSAHSPIGHFLSCLVGVFSVVASLSGRRFQIAWAYPPAGWASTEPGHGLQLRGVDMEGLSGFRIPLWTRVPLLLLPNNPRLRTWTIFVGFVRLFFVMSLTGFGLARPLFSVSRFKCLKFIVVIKFYLLF